MTLRFLRLSLSFLIAVAAGVSASAATANPPKPNIVLIVADDLGFSDLGCYGGEINTPHLDRLAADGVRFTQFYNAGTGVLSRASLFTGLYPRLGPAGSTRGLLRPDMATLGEVMREAGFATILTGKWPLGAKEPNRAIDRGFGEFYGVLDSLSHHFDPAKPDPADFVETGKSRVFAHNDQPITQFPADFYSSDAFSDHAIEMIHRSAEARQPFFISLCYTAPHYPIHAPAEDIARYRGKYADGYDAVRERRHRRQIELGLFEAGTAELSPAAVDHLYEHEFRTWKQLNPPTRAREEERMEAYAGMVDRLDQGVGRVLAALDKAGVAEHTAVFFLSDNGGCAHFPFRSVEINPRQEREPVHAFNRGIPVGDGSGFEFVGLTWGWVQNAPFRRHKNWTYEGGICTPMIVRWPGVVSPGSLTHKAGHVIDFMPTLIEMVGAKYPQSSAGQPILPMEGRSLLPILRGDSPEPRTLPLGWELYGSRAIRDGDWKLLWDAGHKVWSLFDLGTDRSETVNLADLHPERVAAMAAAWEQWARQTSAPIR